jgi:WD40 repeat protein
MTFFRTEARNTTAKVLAPNLRHWVQLRPSQSQQSNFAFKSPDGKYIASGAIDGIINIFDMPTGKLLNTPEGHAMPIRSLTFSPDSTKLLTGSDDGHMKIYDVYVETKIQNCSETLEL